MEIQITMKYIRIVKTIVTVPLQQVIPRQILKEVQVVEPAQKVIPVFQEVRAKTAVHMILMMPVMRTFTMMMIMIGIDIIQTRIMPVVWMTQWMNWIGK